MDFKNLEPREIELARSEPPAPPARDVFSWAAFGGGLAALLWLAGAIGVPLSLYGAEGLAALHPAQQAAFAALALGPAALFWLCAAAAGEAARARAMAGEAAALARETFAPDHTRSLAAQRFGADVRAEIQALNESVDAALDRLGELDSAAQRNAGLFSQTLAATRDDADVVLQELSREREAFAALKEDIRAQTEALAQQVGRQVRLLREASKLVTSEMCAAENALEDHLAAFNNAAAVMAQRTHAFQNAATLARSSSHSMEETMGAVLEQLGEATKLTDTARRSAEEAAHAATGVASAVREATQVAIFEARKAPQLIRAESAALQDSAKTMLATLKEAAEAAREASHHAQAAADRHAASIQQRVSALAAQPMRPAAPVQQARTQAAAPRQAQADMSEECAPAKAVGARGFSGLKGVTGWSNVMPPSAMRAAALDEDSDIFALADFGAPANDPDAVLKSQAMELITSVGVELDETLDAAALEQIAHRSRMGALARRRAVTEAAPVAVSRIARHVKRNQAARIVANDFRSRPDLAKSEETSSDLVRAFLLIDAALA